MNTSNFTPIESSNVSGAFHDGEDLFLQFVKGPVYRYIEVPHKVFEELVSAESAGKYFHAYIKPNYNAEKVKETDIE